MSSNRRSRIFKTTFRDWAIWLGAATLLAAVTLALARFGGTQDRVLYTVVLTMLIPTLAACWLLDERSIGIRAQLLLALVGLMLALRATFEPTLEARGYLLALLGWMTLVTALWLASERGTRRLLVWSLLALGGAEAIYGFLQVLGGVDRIFEYQRRLGRIATGTLINRNHFAALLNLVLPVGLAVSLAGLDPTRRGGSRARPRSEQWAQSWLLLLPLTVFSIAVLLSRSRAGSFTLLATMSFVGLLLMLRRRRNSRGAYSPALVASFVALTLGFGALVGIGGLKERFGEDAGDLRESIYRDTLRLIADHPWRGVGPGMFEWRYPEVQTIETTRRIAHAHSDYLEIAAEWGLPAAGVFFGFVYWRLASGVRSSLRARRRSQGLLLTGTTGALFGVLLHGLVDFNLQIPAILMVFCLVLALGWTTETRMVPPDRSSSKSSQWPTGLLRLALTLVLVAAGWRTVERRLGLEADIRKPEMRALLGAVASDPTNHKLHMALAAVYRDHPVRRDPAQARTHLDEAVRLNPWSSRAHQELGKLHLAAGEPEDAEGAFLRALSINPRDASSYWLLANLRIRTGDFEGAAGAVGKAVGLDRSLLRGGADLLARLELQATVLDRVWPGDLEARLILVESLVDGWRRRPTGPPPAEALEIWGKTLESDAPPAVEQGVAFIQALLEGGEALEARRQWAALARVNGLADPSFQSGENMVWNGSFDLALEATPLGWRMGNASDVSIEIARARDSTRTSVLDIRFEGEANVDGVLVWQQVVVDPGRRYRLSYDARGDRLSTDRGPYLEVADRNGRQILAAGPELLGTFPWEAQSLELESPRNDNLVVVRLRRSASRKINNRIAGTMWLDNVRLVAIGGDHEDG